MRLLTPPAFDAVPGIASERLLFYFLVIPPMHITRFTDLSLRVLMYLCARPSQDRTTVTEIAERIGSTAIMSLRSSIV